jgi:hypothetical protein
MLMKMFIFHKNTNTNNNNNKNNVCLRAYQQLLKHLAFWVVNVDENANQMIWNISAAAADDDDINNSNNNVCVSIC